MIRHLIPGFFQNHITLTAAIKLFIIIILTAQISSAQSGSLRLRPFLGFQTPISQITSNQFTKADVTNNRIWLTPAYGLQIEVVGIKGMGPYLSIGNSASGYSLWVRHTRSCGSYDGPYRDLSTAISANDIRMSVGYIYSIRNSGTSLKGATRLSVQGGVIIDLSSVENLNAGSSNFGGINRCGEAYQVTDTSFRRRRIGLAIPIQVNIDVLGRKRPLFSVSIYYYQGLTQHFLSDLAYETSNATEKVRIRTNGTAAGFRLSVPIKLARINLDKH